MNKRVTASVFALLLLVVITCVGPGMGSGLKVYGSSAKEVDFQKEKIESFIEKQMKEGKIPGMAVVVVKGNEILYQKGHGYSDVKSGEKVGSDTLFELGSTSKAFTALGILQLEKEGLIKLEDSVHKYLPWLTVSYKGEYRDEKIDGNVEISLKQLLYHTSGIPAETISHIPAYDGEDALEKTVRSLVGTKLKFYPGESHLYATINYDILGLVIQKVSGQSFEQYMKQKVLDRLGLKNTYLSRGEAAIHNMAIGYKIGFLRALPYDAPVFRGNTPAGYYITNVEDMARWLKIQLNTEKPDEFDPVLIEKSQVPDRSVQPGPDGSSYAGGWAVYQSGGGELSHGGSNPNFSSYVVFRPEEKVGVAVLANINSSYTQNIGQGIMEMMKYKSPATSVNDMLISVDNFSLTVLCVIIPILLVILGLFLFMAIELYKKERKFSRNITKNLTGFLKLLLSAAGFGYCLYKIPDILFDGLPWEFVGVWAPFSFTASLVMLFSGVMLFGLYYYSTNMFVKTDEKPWFLIVIISIFSGFGNALIIFIINEALNRTHEFQGGLLIYFFLGLVIYIYGQKLVRTKLITITNNLVYTKRIKLINKILESSYQDLEQLENGKIHAVLNNDTVVISRFANAIITGVTSLITLVCCFIYLGMINFAGLLISIVVILIAVGLYIAGGVYANKMWEQTREIQNIFFSFIHDLLYGFKELSIHRKRREEFKQDMQESCDNYRQKNIQGEMKMAEVFVFGEVLFTFVVGVVAFVFPHIFKDLQNSLLRNYVFVFLYITGPVHGILNTIPNIIQVRISWNKMKELDQELKCKELCPEEKAITKEEIKVNIKDMEFRYKGTNDEAFSIGPIDYGFKSGEIVFITGGNGSGKSTLAKIITGLYAPDKGQILINGRQVSPEELGQEYSAVFNDFHLFTKLYGIEHDKKQNEIESYLRKLQIDDKLQVQDGKFSTLKLSTGQRKRIALLVSYLEDKPLYLFDEWAADQDPEFRRFFYDTLLPELKARGKCVIVITHDDRYFNMADKLIKLDMGKIVS